MKLHQVMKQVVEQRKDVAFYLIMYPAAHMDAKGDIDYAMCAKSNKERLKRFEKSMIQKNIGKADCGKSVVDKNMVWGKQHNISGTPTMFFMDGSRVNGFVELNDLLEGIDAAAGKKK